YQTLAGMQFNIANRVKKGMYLLYADLDNLKDINDTYGHQEGDKVLIETAVILKNNYRRSDIIARIGGDEFVVIPVGSDKDSVEIIMDRLQKAIDAYNKKGRLKYEISLSVGIAYYDPGSP
ncbi:MAG: diguanylate cyclase, partial [Candidatus Aenigmarchaeota archaeon]|nr:diguanylate cyclase [Candidatus Aenigmarchaeota archaeon]